MTTKATAVTSIEQLRTRFEQWRNSRLRTSPIPGELWTAAVEVARRDGVNRTAQALRLDGGKLMRRLVASGSGAAAKPPAFVELIAPPPSGAGEYVVELEDPRGRKLRIQMKGAKMPEVVELTRALLELA